MMRRGKLAITKELYEDDKIDNALFGLRIKVFKVDYEPFMGVYYVYFTSPFCREANNAEEVVEYTLLIANNGYELQESI